MTGKYMTDQPSSSKSMPMGYETAFAMLTAKGAPFELVAREVSGRIVKDFVGRPDHISELLPILASFGGRECMVFGETRIGYADFAEKVREFTAYLMQNPGFQPGDRIAILSFNRPEWVIAMWGIVVAGGVVVALNSWWTTREVQTALLATQTTILIADAKGRELVSSKEQSFDFLNRIIPIEIGSSPKDPGKEPWQNTQSRSGADPAVVFFSSGTTGKAKAIPISHQAWLISLMNAGFAATIAVMMEPALTPATQSIRVLASLPFFHVGGGHGLAFGSIAGGQTLIIPQGKFDPNEALRLIDKEQITRWSAVPSMVQSVCEAARTSPAKLESLQTIGYGAAPSSSRLQALAYQTFSGLKAVSNAYGMTEAGAVFAMNTGKDYRRKPDSVGRAFPTVEIQIVDENGQNLPIGNIGEIQIRGLFLMDGFLQKKVKSPITAQGWLQTGDTGYLDAEGFLFLVGRIKDMIIRGGENIFASEVEARLEEHADIVEAAVIGMKSAEFGEEIRAFVRMETGAKLTEIEVRDWVAQALAKFKVPKVVEFCHHPLPRNVVGKLLKNELKRALDD
jgi:long-chain acyl-CoA synthetase